MRSPQQLLNRLVDQFREWLTPRGRYLFWVSATLALMGLNPKTNQVFKVFAIPASFLAVAALFSFLRAPRAKITCSLPSRATAGTSLPIAVSIAAEGPSVPGPLLLSFPRSPTSASSVSFEPRQSVLNIGSKPLARSEISLTVSRRGRYQIVGPTLRRTDPLGLVGGRATRLSDQFLLVYPRFFSMESFRLPLGRRYQPGGIPLASRTGDSLEFLGTREYRPGDPIKHIHWRSWARVGKPVVMEFQEEYFARIAIVLDTFSPKRPTPGDKEAFETTVSVVASVADYFSRSDYIVDIFAAGPDIYEVSAGRSLAYLDNILEVLACLEPSLEPPFGVIGPALFEKLEQITSVVAVLQDWDDDRETFLRRVREFGVELRIIIVRDGETSKQWLSASEDLGDISVMRPQDIERALGSEQA